MAERRPRVDPRPGILHNGEWAKRPARRGASRSGGVCMLVYLGSDEPLPEIPWDAEARGFHIVAVGERAPAVRQHLGQAYVYDVGSHTMCGCGFQLSEYPAPPDEDEEDIRRSLGQLADYLQTQLRAGREAVFFACWEGDEGEAPPHRRRLTVADLRGDEFHFIEEGEVSSIVADASGAS
jgi:hypothetical protein